MVHAALGPCLEINLSRRDGGSRSDRPNSGQPSNANSNLSSTGIRTLDPTASQDTLCTGFPFAVNLPWCFLKLLLLLCEPHPVEPPQLPRVLAASPQSQGSPPSWCCQPAALHQSCPHSQELHWGDFCWCSFRQKLFSNPSYSTRSLCNKARDRTLMISSSPSLDLMHSEARE